MKIFDGKGAETTGAMIGAQTVLPGVASQLTKQNTDASIVSPRTWYVSNAVSRGIRGIPSTSLRSVISSAGRGHANGRFLLEMDWEDVHSNISQGARTQHPPKPCQYAVPHAHPPCRSDFRVLHTNGIHEVSLSYCGCPRALPHHIQLLRRGLYPSSQIFSRTCVTFTLLRFIHLLSLTSKISMYDLYRTLERLTDNAGSSVPKIKVSTVAPRSHTVATSEDVEACWQST